MEEEPKLYRAIMVSSTFTDLEAHRREVIDAIHRFGFHANVMEYSGARSDADVIETSLQMVRASFAYLCVIGHKYGQTPADPVRNPKGLSITELEFEEARRLGRPILLFLMSERHSMLPADFEPDEKKRRKLEAFRKQAKRIDPKKAPERVYEMFSNEAEFAKKAAIAVGLLAVQAAGGSDVPGRAIRDAIARFIDIKPEATHADLTEAIQRFETDYRALEQQLAAIAVTDNRVTSLKADAEAALAEGDLDKARAAYREAAEAARDKAAEPVRTAAELKAAEAEAHLLALDWQAADSAWDDAAAMLAPFDPAAAVDLSEDAGERLGKHGDLYARAGALSAASDRLRALAVSAEARGDEVEAARLRNNLGIQLSIQGKRTGGAEGLRLLDEAVTAFRDTLTIHTKARTSDQWAASQNNLANALKAQAERTGGAEGLRLLDEAVTAYRDALTVYTRADKPAEWAMTKNNLGNALAIQAERTDGVEGVRLLDEAVTAYRDALTVRTHAATPTEWAKTQNNLGSALATHGARVGGVEGLRLLDEAVTAFREALTVRTRTSMPADFSGTQNNLGGALQSYGELTGGAEGLRLLEKAITAYRDALIVYTRADMSTHWAMIHENIGLALERLAKANPDRARAYLIDAEEAFIAALSVYTPEHMSFDHDKATRSLARIRAKLAALAS